MEQHINNIISTIESAIDDFQKQVPGIQQAMFDNLQESLRELKVQNGSVLASLDNLKKLADIRNRIERIVLTNGYKEQVKKFVSSYIDLRDLHNQYFSQFNVKFGANKSLEMIAATAIDSTLNSLIGAGVSVNITDKVGNILKNNITAGVKYADMLNQLRDHILTNGQNQGLLERYTKQITTDAINQYSAQYHQAVASDLNFTWGRYVGSNIRTSREFCLTLTEKDYIHKSELPDIIKGHIDGHQCKLSKVTGLPLGMIVGTTPSNFQIYRGGYNCGHQFMMVPDSAVPEAIRNRISIPPVDKLKKQGYETIAHDEKKGNYVMAHPDHVVNKNKKDGDKEMANNKAMAKLYFDRGASIELLPANYSTPSLDAKIDGKLWEFENVKNNNHSSIQHRISEASKQILHYNKFNNERNPVNISIGLPEDVSIKNIYSAIRLSLLHNYKLDQLNFSVGNKLIELTKDDLDKGRFYTIIADILKR